MMVRALMAALVERKSAQGNKLRHRSIDEMREMTEGNKIQQLRENRAATIHDVVSFARKIGKDTG